MKHYKFKQIKRKNGSEYFYKKLFHRNLVSQSIRGDVVRTASKRISEATPSRKMETSERVQE